MPKTKDLDRVGKCTPHKVDFIQLDASTDSSLRPYQSANKNKIYRFWQKGRSVMLQMPTGTGKTRLFVSIVKDLHNWGAKNKKAVKVLLLAHRVELIDQISYNLGIKYNLAHGLIIANNKEQMEYPIQVGSVPTLNRRLDGWANKDFDVIIVDEAHHIKAESYKKILNEYPNAKVLGVTATPYRLNGAGFKDIFEELIVSDSVAKFIKNRFLSEYDYFSITPLSKTQKEIEGISKFALDGDYLDSAMIEVVDTDRVRAGIVKTYMNFAVGKKGIVYTINKAHNERVCSQFVASGILAKTIDSDTDANTRKSIVSDFKDGKFHVLCNVNIFSEGFDCPDIEFIQLARPTKSLSMFLQQIGRGLRFLDGKDKVIFLDNVGLYNRFGLPSARRMWKKHFEGKYVTDAELRGESDIEEREVHFFNEYEEGDETVDLIHSSELESVTEMETKLHKNNTNMKNYKDDFCSFMKEEGLSPSAVSSYTVAIAKHVDPYIREKIDSSHDSVFNTIDIELIGLLQEELFNEGEFSKLNSEKHNRFSAAVKKYIEFAKSYGNKEAKNFTNTSSEHVQRTIDVVNSDIALFSKHRVEIPEDLLVEKRKLESANIRSLLLGKIPRCLDGAFEGIDEDISIYLHYSPISGLRVNILEGASKAKSTSTITSSNREKLRVTFEDGTVIQRPKVKETLIEVVKIIGASNIEKLNIKHCSFPLIDKKLSEKAEYAKAQVEVGTEQFLNTNSSTSIKKKQIEEISQKLGLNIKVEAI